MLKNALLLATLLLPATFANAHEYSAGDLHIAHPWSLQLPPNAPNVAAYLEKAGLTNAQISGLLVYGDENKADAAATAENFLKTEEAVWTEWVPADVAEKVKASVPAAASRAGISFIVQSFHQSGSGSSADTGGSSHSHGLPGHEILEGAAQVKPLHACIAKRRLA